MMLVGTKDNLILRLAKAIREDYHRRGLIPKLGEFEELDEGIRKHYLDQAEFILTRIDQ